MTQRWKHRPPGSNWGDFGPDDQRGRMNYVTREKVLQGIAEVKEGLAFCLSLPLDYPGGNVLNPRRHPPRQFATLRGGTQNFCYPMSRDNAINTDVVCDDLVVLTLQYSTQWDSFAHIGSQFDADGDGEAGDRVLQRLSRRRAHQAGDGEPGRGAVGKIRRRARRGARHREPRRARRAGARRDDRPATTTSGASARR